MESDDMTDVTPTRDKLKEAGFFLSKMSEAADDWDAFRFYLCAFISAARNVTWIMEKQYADFDGFKDWLTLKQAEMAANPLMKYFKAQRNQITKERIVTSLPLAIPLENDDSNKVMTVFFIEGTGAVPQPLKINIPLRPGSIHYFSDFHEKDAVSLCRDYLEEIEKVVSDLESRFGERA